MQGTKEVSEFFVAVVQGLLRIWQFVYLNFLLNLSMFCQRHSPRLHPLTEQAHAEHLLHTDVWYIQDRFLENWSGE